MAGIWHQAGCCCGSCLNEECDDEQGGCLVTTTGECGCVGGPYDFWGGSGKNWAWRGGYCSWGTGGTDFGLQVTCEGSGQHKGKWHVVITSYEGGYTIFEGWVTGLTCIEGALTGTITIPGKDNPLHDCSGQTATVVF